MSAVSINESDSFYSDRYCPKVWRTRSEKRVLVYVDEHLVLILHERVEDRTVYDNEKRPRVKLRKRNSEHNQAHPTIMFYGNWSTL